MINLKVEKREKVGGLSSKQAIYKNKKVPAIIYGGNKEPMPILLENKELIRIVSAENVFGSVVELEIGDSKEMVVFKEVQKHPSKNIFIHVDLLRVAPGKKVNVTVPVNLINIDKCYGIKIEGGVINHVIKEIDILAKAEKIPESIDIDMEEVKSKEKLRLSSLEDNEDFDFPSALKAEDPVIVSVLTARGGAMLLDDELEGEVDAEDQEGEDAAADNEDGNPGEKYNKTRHNAGCDFIDLIASELQAEFKLSKKFDAEIADISYKEHQISLIKPKEFINRSGKTLKLLRKFQVDSNDKLLVLHDDMDLEPGEVKLKIGGGHAGHNGLRDISQQIGSDYVRLRFGIGHPPSNADTNAWVIKKPNPEEKMRLKQSFEKALDSLDPLLQKKWMIAMNALHTDEH